jgi:hypothetical protein
MTGEIPAPERGSEALDITELQISMRQVIEFMRDVSRSTGAPGAHDFVPEEMLSRFKIDAERANGALIEAGSEISSYYFMADELGGAFGRGRFQPHLHSTTPFYGVQRGVEELTVKDDMGTHRYLCLALDPLYSTFDSSVTSYFANRGRVNFLAHPFGLTEHTHQRLWVPVFDIAPTSLEPLHMPGK